LNPTQQQQQQVQLELQAPRLLLLAPQELQQQVQSLHQHQKHVLAVVVEEALQLRHRPFAELLSWQLCRQPAGAPHAQHPHAYLGLLQQHQVQGLAHCSAKQRMNLGLVLLPALQQHQVQGLARYPAKQTHRHLRPVINISSINGRSMPRLQQVQVPKL
jgi:hypothetical protein